MVYKNKRTVIYAPSYYKEFCCIADKCRHSCCIDWEIVIDGATLERYKALGPSMTDTLTVCDGEASFTLTPDGRCPHLTENGLCSIIISHGDGYLSDICKNHPRFFNDVGTGVREAGLGLVCEEAARLIIESPLPFSLTEIGAAELEDGCCDAPSIFDPIPERNRIISLLESGDGSLAERIAELRRVHGIPPLYSKEEWVRRLLELEILDTGWELTLKKATSTEAVAIGEEHEEHLTRLITYFIYRHVSVARSHDELRARLAFSILSLEMIVYLFEREKIRNTATLIDIARRYSAEIEYSEDNTAELIFEFESEL